MEQCFQQVLSTLLDDVIIKDFDVMFNPDYEVDVLRIMCFCGQGQVFLRCSGQGNTSTVVYSMLKQDTVTTRYMT